jgi:hypothetical protein
MDLHRSGNADVAIGRSATRRGRSGSGGGISGGVPDFGLQICVCRSLLPPIGHNAPLSVATSSRQNRLDRVVEVLRPLAPRARHFPAKGHMSDKRKPDQTFGPLLGSFGNKESRQRTVERQLCTLISDEFDFRFPLLDVGNPEARRNYHDAFGRQHENAGSICGCRCSMCRLRQNLRRNVLKIRTDCRS